ncbi:MAG: biotin synthase BioB [Kiritimatiellae bacterium]|nr:biotin synthase BioB [Kiritimatiellia bacterium]
MNAEAIRQIRALAEAGRAIPSELGLGVLRAGTEDVPDLLAAATALRRRFFPGRLTLCAIVNAKSGACSEDCAFCAQSAANNTQAEVFPLKSAAEIGRARESAARLPVSRFGIVTSGKGLTDADLDRVCEMVRAGGQAAPRWCASLGCLSRAQFERLRDAGLTRFHHNLETAASFYPRICSTHGYAERLATVRAAKELGFDVCSGGILGMGETLEQRVELAAALAREQVDSIPLNFLIPIPGTRLAAQPPMKPLDIIRSILLFRLLNPEAELKVCAGRAHLRDLQALIFYAGATGIMIGALLTVPGGDVERDLAMLRDLELL